jgi:hypothetical protein
VAQVKRHPDGCDGEHGLLLEPIFNIWKWRGYRAILVNAQHIKAVPGRKTDVKDSEWIARLLRHGLVRGSLVPRAKICLI